MHVPYCADEEAVVRIREMFSFCFFHSYLPTYSALDNAPMIFRSSRLCCTVVSVGVRLLVVSGL
jgi:hypothetical protein